MQVMRGLHSVRDEGSVTRRQDLGVTIVHAPQPLHYYALFSWTAGADVVVSMYSGNRYEVECKYTQYVNLHSRPVWPRINMRPLAEVRNSARDDDPTSCSVSSRDGCSNPATVPCMALVKQGVTRPAMSGTIELRHRPQVLQYFLR